jgi:hypothetical protein
MSEYTSYFLVYNHCYHLYELFTGFLNLSNIKELNKSLNIISSLDNLNLTKYLLFLYR